ncbi:MULTISPECIES: O-antigen ligase family protein [Chryseobacterium]|uniref:Lipid A core - O-antigen ligase and related enzymes n=1 Tax=Chryseobacterium taihuense TaxID=1141221 RepID=A0A4U8WCN1_9FLAO|nr:MULTISPECIES: O-antigen ligase family protein [Chryseobacterium]QQV03379.1 O-antigen ligase family protein [Chryseobacterium sp. FDAARGOS 1104]VFB03306.1 Lipid A core - O-antigen ligase and related enzymes [Chryseobacterium taihuense]
MKNKIIGFLILVLFLIAPFIQSDTSDESQPDILLSIPPFISVVAFYFRWFIFLFLALYFLLYTKVLKKFITKYNILFFLFYLFPFLYSLVTLTDLPRYFSLLLFGFFLPIVITSEIKDNKGYLKFVNLQKIVFVFISLSIIVSYKTVFSGLRFQGILGNANMYGISAVFWMSLIQLCKKTKFNLILTVIIFITIVLSGSRGSLLAGVVVIFLSYSTYIKKLLIGSILILSMFTIISNFVNLDFILNRFDNISESAKESGRQEIWEKAFLYIKMNPLGNGMNAPLELVGSGNVHNCYVRFLLTMGYPFTIIILLFFALIIFFAWKDKKVPRPLVGFLIGYVLANFGEDFYVGIGSSMFIYVILTIGLISYFSLIKNKYEYSSLAHL